MSARCEQLFAVGYLRRARRRRRLELFLVTAVRRAGGLNIILSLVFIYPNLPVLDVFEGRMPAGLR